MDIVEKRMVVLNKNVLRQETINVSSEKHNLLLKREGRVYVVSLNDSKGICVGARTFLTKTLANKYYDKLLKKYGSELVKTK